MNVIVAVEFIIGKLMINATNSLNHAIINNIIKNIFFSFIFSVSPSLALLLYQIDLNHHWRLKLKSHSKYQQ